MIPATLLQSSIRTEHSFTQPVAERALTANVVAARARERSNTKCIMLESCWGKEVLVCEFNCLYKILSIYLSMHIQRGTAFRYGLA